ncbi:MAG: hypothetical protein K2Y22_04320 [Candidatus Obscuribacterales bacterium]|nr:hypothetical protein [Candidatus Obscuribacterales bacterium]
MSKANGLEPRYEVKKLTNPTKEFDCVVLEFDDPIARVGILAWAKEMKLHGYEKVYEDVIRRMYG